MEENRRNPVRDRRMPAHLNDFEVDALHPNPPPVDGQQDHGDENQGEVDLLHREVPEDYPVFDNQSHHSGSRSVRTNQTTSTATRLRHRETEAELAEAERIAQMQIQAETEAADAELEAELAAARAKARIKKVYSQLDSQKKLSKLRVEAEKSRLQVEEEEGTASYSPPNSVRSFSSRKKTEAWVQSQKNTENPIRVQNLPTEPKHLNFQATPFLPKTTSTPFLQEAQTYQPSYEQSNHQPVFTYRKFPDLIPFGGEIKDWPLFLSDYNMSTKMYGIPDVYNISRLKKALKGEAKTAVHALLLHEGNLPRIIKTLERRFGRKNEIIEKMIEEVRKFPNVRERQYHQVIQLSELVSNMTAMINSFGRPDYLTNTMLLKEITDKLPTSLHMLWMETLPDDGTTSLDVFEEWLTLKTEKLIPHLSSSSTASAKPETRRQNERGTRAVHVTKDPELEVKESESEVKKPKPSADQKPDNPPRNKCLYCDKPGHRAWMCRQLIRDPMPTRRNKVRQKRLCFGCLGYGHTMKDDKCKYKKDCPEPGCGKQDHKLLHDHEPKVVNTTIVPNSTQMMFNGRVGCQIVPVMLHNGKYVEKVYAFLDLGSDLTLLDESVAKKLNLDGPSEPLTFHTLGGPATYSSKVLEMKIANILTGESFDIGNVHTHPDLSMLKRGSVSRKMVKDSSFYRELQGNIEVFENQQPLMLIGLPHANLITPIESIVPEKNGPVAANTKLGWTIFGPMVFPDSTKKLPSNYFVKNPQVLFTVNSEPVMPSSDPDLKLHKLVEGYFHNETLGIQPRSKEDSSPENRKAMEIANSTLRRVDDKFEIGLLWKNDPPSFPDNFKDAFNRLKSQERKMDKDSSYAKKYVENMQAYIDKGYMRKLSSAEVAITSPRTWYLPHFSVVNPQKPEKMRMVLDAAAVTDGKSLNSELMPGPDILKSLPGILCQFREKKIELAADIKEMFHQVRIKVEDQDAQRILWRGMDRDRKPDVYAMKVMIFGATCSPFCAQFVKNYNAELYAKEFPEASKAIVDSHYVDDLLKSVDEVPEGLKMYNGITEVHGKGGFTICNWVSNSPEVIQAIPVELRSKSLKEFTGKEELQSEKILGLVWNPQHDQFKFNTTFAKIPEEILSGREIPSRRQILSTVMSVYDPLGFSANVAIKAKLLVQKCWKLGIGWDDPITENLFEIWKDWLELVRRIDQFALQRCYSPAFSKAEEIQLHVFCDGSEQAYGAVAYFRIKNKSNIETCFVSAKSKVLPIKQTFKENVTVPRAELQAGVMGVRLANSLTEWHSVKPNKTFFWSDSTTALHWLKMDHSRLKMFVANRVAEIQDSTTNDQWRYIPTDLNVADDVTKASIPVSFDPESRWICGPDFLKLDESQWPVMPTNAKPDESAIQAEIKKLVISVDTFESAICFKKFSSFSRLVRVTAQVRRFLNPDRKNFPKYLTIEELRAAEETLFRLAQQESYLHLSKLHTSKTWNTDMELRKKHYGLSHLSLYIDSEGLIRMKGRVQHHVPGSDVQPNPILLHPKHHLTRLIIQDQHEKFMHQGREAVVNAIKAKFCIPTVREAVKKTIADCQHCKNLRLIPKPPEMAPIPSCRTAAFTRPFTHTGVDYFGPITVTIGRRNEKRYGVIFTCMTTRAVHVELAVDLSSDGFINCLRRFMCDRACPAHMYSDNGTNFVGAEAELREELQKLINEEVKLQDFVSRFQMTWQFIPPHSPHMGGCWERMVRYVKTCLSAILKEQKPKEDTLRTFLKEAQAVVNSHPLGYVSSDPESFEVLTPNHFLFGSATIIHPPGVFSDKDLLRARQWRIAQRMADQFWKRWLKEVLPLLNPRSKWLQPQTPLKIGDIVVILDENSPRSFWPKGRIIKLFPGKDGQTRSATIKTVYGEYTRPTTKIAVLDVLPDDENSTEENQCNQIQFLHDFICENSIQVIRKF